MIDTSTPTELFQPFIRYSSVHRIAMSILISVITLLGLLLFFAAFRQGPGRAGSEEWFLGICGCAFLCLAWHILRFIRTPRLRIEKEFFVISDFFRRRKLYYQEIHALAYLVRIMPIRFNPNNCLHIPVLVIRLHSKKLVQFALPRSSNAQACLEALTKASGLPIETLPTHSC